MPEGRVEDFDFLVGRWEVRHECLVGSAWQEFHGSCSMRKLLGGQANLDENTWTTSSGTYRALTVRLFDPERRSWSIFWLDTRWPMTFGPPVAGSFDGARGVFLGVEELDGNPIWVRFHWFVESRDTCRWQQAYSFDGGATWETNWRMHFARETSPPS